MKFLCEVEKDGDGFIASCDELRAIANGDTEEEAIANLKEAIAELLSEYSYLQASLKQKKRFVLEVM